MNTAELSERRPARTASRRMIVDGLTMPTPERKWLQEWRDARLDCVNNCIAVWENATEAMATIGKWRQLIDENKDLVAAATSVAEIEAIAASGRTAIVFGFQNTAPIEHNIDLFRVFRD